MPAVNSQTAMGEPAPKANVPATEAEARALLPGLFQRLDVASQEQIESTCDILEVCFSKLSLEYLTENATDNIIKVLEHTSPKVRQLAINEIFRVIRNNETLYPLPENMNTAVAVTRCLGDQDLSVAIRAMDILALRDWLKYPQIVNEMINILDNKNSSYRCRCYEVVVNIVKKSPERIKDTEIENLLQRLISELKTEDILEQLNVFELLSDLVVTSEGLNFLIDNDVLRILSDLFGKMDGNPIGGLVIPGLMKFFGSVAHLYPTEVCNNYPSVMQAIFNAIHDNNSSILPTALDTLGHIGATAEGKLSLGAQGRVYLDALTDVGSYIKNSPTETRVRALNCAESLIRINDKEDITREIDTTDQRIVLMTREWFRQLSERPESIELLFGICKNPFPELRIASLGLLSAICLYQWGVELVKFTPGLIEFLLNRSVEHDKESKHLKYSIIILLARFDIFDVSTSFRFKEFVKDGPFYVQAIAEVAIEGE